MREYAYPSGLEIHPDTGVDSVWLLHLGLGALVMASILLLVWRARRPASGWDVPLWIVALVAEWNLAIWIFRYFVVGDSVFPLYFVVMFLIAVAASTITIWRCTENFELRASLIFLVIAGVAAIFILPAVQQAREAARRTQCKNYLKQIGLAIQNYADTHGQFPYAGNVLSDSEQVCSWRLVLWPAYMEAIPVNWVYHHDEPWDSPFNSQTLERGWSPYHCPSHNKHLKYTDYSMLTGPGTIGGDGVTVVKPADVTDGAANTIFFVEACGTEILFTEPKDVEVTEASLGVNLPGERPGLSRGIISSQHVGGAHVLLGDGTVRFISEKIDRSVLKGLTTIAGGETLPEW